MSGAHIRTRVTKSGNRYDVRYRLGGRDSQLHHAGTFRTLKEARIRRDLVAGEIAAGRDPKPLLARLAAPTDPTRLADRWDAFIASRIDVSDSARSLYRNARDRFALTIGERDPASVTVADVQTALAAMGDLAPKTLSHYLSTLRQVLDFCDVQPNPARSRKIKLPAERIEEPAPPSAGEWAAVRAHLWPRSLLALRLAECCALRISETLSLRYGDVDFAEQRIRVSRARTKGRTAGQRWLPVPAELLDEIAELVPLEDRRRERAVFTLNDDGVRGDLYRACRDAGIASYSPHDLRDRRISLWFAHGFDPIQVKTWAGHAKASMSMDVYAHVVVEPEKDEWRAFWTAAYQAARRPKGAAGEARVMHEGGPDRGKSW